MFPIVLVVVVLVASITAVAVDLLYGPDKPATDGDESPSGAEPWAIIWGRVRRTVGGALGAAHSVARATGRQARAVPGGLARAGRAAGRSAVGAVRNAQALDALVITGMLARAANLRERRALQRATGRTRTPIAGAATIDAPVPAERAVEPARRGPDAAHVGAVSARHPVDPRRRSGVPVPLGTPATARLRALAALLAMTTVLGVAVAGAFLGLTVVVLRALSGL